jgi:hypothetical protein
MVPFSFTQPLLKSRVMNTYTSSSAPVEVWKFPAQGFSGARSWGFGAFALSCFRAFLILIPAPVFRVYPVLVASRSFLKTQKRLNEPN